MDLLSLVRGPSAALVRADMVAGECLSLLTGKGMWFQTAVSPASKLYRGNSSSTTVFVGVVLVVVVATDASCASPLVRLLLLVFPQTFENADVFQNPATLPRRAPLTNIFLKLHK